MVKIKQKIVTVVLILLLAAAAVVTVSLGATSARADSNMDTPQITVLTHGWGSEAKTWSSKDGLGLDFAQDNDSLLYKLSQKSGGAYIYRAETNGGDVGSTRYDLYADYGQTKTNINSVSKHIIIVFDSKNTNNTNDIVFSEFKYMLNDVISKVQNLNSGGRMPKINLIGHSRGGITNLQYALEYPERVHSLISIGTPYFGSEAAREFGRLLFTRDPNLKRDGLDDIVDSNIYNGYYQTWKDGYEGKYKNINSIAIGGATEVNYQRDVIKAKGGNFSDALSTLLTFYSNAVLQGLSLEIMKASYSLILSQYPQIGILDEQQFINLITLLDSEIDFGTWFSDVLVPVDSQQGFNGDKNYYFSKYVKIFNKENASVNPKVADGNNLAVIHNLEPYDADIHNYILRNIIMKAGDTIDNEISNVGRLWSGKWQIKIRNTNEETRTYALTLKCVLRVTLKIGQTFAI